ncbi:MAG: hypothetical protein ABWZ79_05975, partial [Pedobacter agri]
EWVVTFNPNVDIPYFDRSDTRCVCTQSIKHIYYIRNITNNNFLVTGSECINKLHDTCILKISFKEHELNEKMLKKIEKQINKTSDDLCERADKIKSAMYQKLEDEINDYNDSLDEAKNNIRNLKHFENLFNSMSNKLLLQYNEKTKQIFNQSAYKTNNLSKYVNVWTIKFGKHKGKTYSQLPKHYVKWLYGEKNDDYNNDMLDYVYGLHFP